MGTDKNIVQLSTATSTFLPTHPTQETHATSSNSTPHLTTPTTPHLTPHTTPNYTTPNLPHFTTPTTLWSKMAAIQLTGAPLQYTLPPLFPPLTPPYPPPLPTAHYFYVYYYPVNNTSQEPWEHSEALDSWDQTFPGFWDQNYQEFWDHSDQGFWDWKGPGSLDLGLTSGSSSSHGSSPLLQEEESVLQFGEVSEVLARLHLNPPTESLNPA